MASDFQLEDTLYLPFTTRAYATGIPTVLASGQVDIYEDATATPIITSETFVSDLNSVAGLNMVTITATAATGFGAGQHYSVVLGAGTVDSVSVIGEVVATFTLDMSGAALDLANATDGLGAIKTFASDAESNVVVVAADVLISQSEVSQILSETTAIESLLDDGTIGLNALETITSNTHSLLTLVEVIASDAESNVVVVAAQVATIESEVSAILVDTSTTLEARLSDVESSLVIVKSDTLRLELAQIVITGVVEGTPTTTVIATDATEVTDAHYANMTFMMTNGDENGESRRISAYSGATGQFTLDTALSGTPAVGETFVVINAVTLAGALTAKQDSDITEIASNLIEVQSDVVVVDQDTSDLKSTLLLVKSEVSDALSRAVLIHSETTAILVDTGTTLETRQATIASDLLLVLSDTSDTLSLTQ